MKYSLNLSADGRILSATFAKYAPSDAVLVDTLPDGNIIDYLYKDGKFVYDPLPVQVELDDEPTEADDTAAMLVDHEYRLTLLELGV